MARCIICGDRLKVLRNSWDLGRRKSISAMLQEHGIYVSYTQLDDVCFGQCTGSLGTLYLHAVDFCREQDLKDCANARDYLLQKVSQNKHNKLFDLAAFTNFVNSAYRDAEKLCIRGKQIDEAYQKLTALFQSRIDAFAAAYPNFVYAQDPKFNHVCATKRDQSLVIIENSCPKLEDKLYRGPLKKVQDTYQQLQELDDRDMFAITTIPLSDIISFQLVGDIDRVATTSGGGGGSSGPNIGGAIVGGLLFGTVGAIIGAQAGTGVNINPIQSTINEYDTRRTLLNLKNADGVAEIRELPFYYAEIFTKVIPEKEFSFLQAERNSSTAPVKENPQNDNAIEAIKKFKELLDMGIITQEEFDTKKKQLLGL